MLSNTSRWLTYLLSFLYAILGFLLFFFSKSLAPVFALIGIPLTWTIFQEGTGLRQA